MGRRSRRVNKVESVAAATFRNASLSSFIFLPPFPQDSISGDFYRYELGDYFTRQGDTKRSEKGVASEIKRKVTLDSYSLKEHAKRGFLNDIEEELTDDAVKSERTITFDVTNQILLAHEVDTRDFMLDDDNFGTVTDLSLTPTDQWSDYDNSDPEDQMLEFRLALLPYIPFGVAGLSQLVLGLTPNDIKVLMKHPKFLDRYSNTDGNLGLSQLAEYMKVGRIVPLEQYINTKNEADPTQMSDPTLEPLYEDMAILAYVDPTPSWGSITWGFSLSWRMPKTQRLAPTIDGGRGLMIRIRDYRDEERGGGGEFREADAFLGHKIVFPFLALKIENPTA